MNSDPHQEPILEGHEADGIKELDNLLPRWWVWLFYGTIAFSFIYMAYYHGFKAGALQADAYQQQMILGDRIKSEAVARFESSIRTLSPSTNPAVLGPGQQTFSTMCAPCHRPDGGGLVGPNLCDDYFIHGSNYVDSIRIILNGVPEKGMLSWRGILKPAEIQSVASYIYTLRGTKPPNPKPREDQVQAVPDKPNEFE